MSDDEHSRTKPPFQFVKTEGSPITGRHKDKQERISETISDLQLALDGVRVQSSELRGLEQLAQSTSALARACSIFMRKMVLGDRSQPKSRLLDDDICRSLNLDFDRIRKVPLCKELLVLDWSISNGDVQLTKLDDDTLAPQDSYHIPVAPLQFKLLIDWPLPGTASWTNAPTKKNPWVVEAEELFDLGSTNAMSCSEWLGQQLVMFDNKGISLKEVISTVANYEGAHSIDASRLDRVGKERPSNHSKNPERHILNNIIFFRVKYTHIIVIESAYYLYNKLLSCEDITHPIGGFYLAKHSFVWDNVEDALSSNPTWLSYDGGITVSFGGQSQVVSHKIRSVR